MSREDSPELVREVGMFHEVASCVTETKVAFGPPGVAPGAAAVGVSPFYS